MKQVLLLFAKVSAQSGMTHPDDLVALLNSTQEGIVAHGAFLEDLLYSMDGPLVDVTDAVSGKSLQEYDVVYFRYWGQAPAQAMAAARFCELRGIPYVDKEVLRLGSYNKMSQYMHLHAAQVAIPKTLIGSPALLADRYQRYGFAFPLIMKSIIGTRGQDNYLVKDEAELRTIAAEKSVTPFVMQEFIPNNGDYRVLVMGDKVVGVIERIAAGDSHLNNTSQGGSASWVDIDILPVEVRDMCVRGAKFLRRDIAGVDIVQSLANHQYYCFEVNRSPQIEHAAFADKKATLLARYLTSL